MDEEKTGRAKIESNLVEVVKKDSEDDKQKLITIKNVVNEIP